MAGQESSGTSRDKLGTLSAEQLLGRLQELADTKPFVGGYPLEWAVPAFFLGDMSGLASLSLRSGH